MRVPTRGEAPANQIWHCSWIQLLISFPHTGNQVFSSQGTARQWSLWLFANTPNSSNVDHIFFSKSCHQNETQSNVCPTEQDGKVLVVVGLSVVSAQETMAMAFDPRETVAFDPRRASGPAGDNANGQLGLQSTNATQFTFAAAVPVWDTTATLTAVAAGSGHTVVVAGVLPHSIVWAAGAVLGRETLADGTPPFHSLSLFSFVRHESVALCGSHPCCLFAFLRWQRFRHSEACSVQIFSSVQQSDTGPHAHPLPFPFTFIGQERDGFGKLP